jgi:hypothetical protein
VEIIEHLSNGLKGVEEDRTKRSRSDNLVGTEPCAIALMHFLESQDLEAIAPAPVLVSTGLQSLSDILDKQANINTSVADYLQQALLSMMTSAVTRIQVSCGCCRAKTLLTAQLQDAASMASEAIGVEVIVKMIRGKGQNDTPCISSDIAVNRFRQPANLPAGPTLHRKSCSFGS